VGLGTLGGEVALLSLFGGIVVLVATRKFRKKLE